jgi:anti-sigma factor RsiW
MNACLDFEPLLLERSCGTLDAEQALRLEAHLGICAACRAEADGDQEALGLLKLPPTRQAERAALAGLADAVRREQRGASRRWPRPALGAATLAVGAVAAAILLTLGQSRHAAPEAFHGATLEASQANPEAWSVPDPGELLEASAAEAEEVSAEVGADDLALAEVLADDDGLEP